MNKKMMGIIKLVWLELIIIIIFIFFKLIRPTVLNSKSSEFFKLILLSLPNFFEAVIGTLTLTGIGLIINDKLSRKYQIRSRLIYILAAVLAGIYVSAQELKIHNLGGNNVFDVNDLLFSFIGLIIGYLIVLLINPNKIDSSKNNL
jgi:hypothetical protein